MRFINLFIIIFTIVSCTRSEQQTNSYEILSVLINKYGRATPPPPPPKGNLEFSKKELDSIYNQKQHIAIYPSMDRIINHNIVNNEVIKEYYSLIQNLSLLETEYIDISLIENIEIEHKLTILDTSKYKNDKYYISKNFDRLLHFSPISFNKEYTKAVTIVGNVIDYLNGYSLLVCLEKVNDIWVIRKTELLEIS